MGLIEHLVALVAFLGSGQIELGTIFGSSQWDAHNPHSRLACYHREIDDKRDVMVAHRQLPCRTKVLVYNPRTGRAAVARVGDRGPRRAGIDLSVALARRLKHNGYEPVLVMPLSFAAEPEPPRKRPRIAMADPKPPQFSIR